MADVNFKVVKESKTMYQGDTYFKNISKQDTTNGWSDTQSGDYIILDKNDRIVDKDVLTKSEELAADGFPLYLELRYVDGRKLRRGETYKLLVSIIDTDTQYKDTVLETTLKVS